MNTATNEMAIRKASAVGALPLLVNRCPERVSGKLQPIWWENLQRRNLRGLPARNPAMMKGHSDFVSPGVVSLSYRCVNPAGAL